jgi:hypothetical protein
LPRTGVLSQGHFSCSFKLFFAPTTLVVDAAPQNVVAVNNYEKATKDAEGSARLYACL